MYELAHLIVIQTPTWKHFIILTMKGIFKGENETFYQLIKRLKRT
jgi:hypothetical protein